MNTNNTLDSSPLGCIIGNTCYVEHNLYEQGKDHCSCGRSPQPLDTHNHILSRRAR